MNSDLHQQEHSHYLLQQSDYAPLDVVWKVPLTRNLPRANTRYYAETTHVVLTFKIA
jgi:hypothetical protein